MMCANLKVKNVWTRDLANACQELVGCLVRRGSFRCDNLSEVGIPNSGHLLERPSQRLIAMGAGTNVQVVRGAI